VRERLGDWETGRLGDWETGRLGDWETGRLGDWETEVQISVTPCNSVSLRGELNFNVQ